MSVLFKQAVAVIDSRTTNVCLKVAGQIVPLDDPFSTLNGDFDQPPFHSHCRTIVQPYMAGFVNEQRDLSNAELQRRPLAERDTRGASRPPIDPSNPPKGGLSMRTPKPKPPSPRSLALDLAEVKRKASTTSKAAKATRDRLAKISAKHKDLMNAIDQWTKGGSSAVYLARGKSKIAKAFKEVAKNSPLTKTVLWRGEQFTDRAYQQRIETAAVGDMLPRVFLRGFTSKRTVAEERLGETIIVGGSSAKSGVIIHMKGGRALPIESVSNHPSEREWIVGHDLKIVSKERLADGLWLIVVKQV